MATMVRERLARAREKAGAPRGARQVNVNAIERIASLAGGGGLAYYGARRKDVPGTVLALVGGMLVQRGVSGFDPLYHAVGVSTAGLVTRPFSVRRAVTVNRPVEDCYRFWRNLENLPRIMEHVESVRVIDSNRSHWRVKAPAKRTVEWDAIIENDIPNQQISWRSAEGATIRNSGTVRFEPAPAGRGTEIYVDLEYDAPAGNLGRIFAKMWGREPDQQLREDLRRFKQIMEAGEIPTTKGQPSGRVS